MSKEIRCAIYTRKSTEEGLDQDLNSLHAQREACEAYIKSQIGFGWKALTTEYDDGGFSGGSMERPTLFRNMLRIDSGFPTCSDDEDSNFFPTNAQSSAATPTGRCVERCSCRAMCPPTRETLLSIAKSWSIADEVERRIRAPN